MSTIIEMIDDAGRAGHQAVQLTASQLRQLHKEILAQSGALAKINVPILPPYSGSYLDLESGQVGVVEGRKTQGTLCNVHVLVDEVEAIVDSVLGEPPNPPPSRP